jgi:hypothetical protein
MAEPTPPAGKGAGGFFKKLSPKQKRYALVIGAGALLGLVYLIYHRGGGAEEGQTPSDSEQAAAGGASLSPAAGGATDPSAFLGAQSEQIGNALGEVSGALGGVESAVQEGNEVEQESDARIAEGLSTQNRMLHHINRKLKGTGPGRNHRAHGGKHHGGPGKQGGHPGGGGHKGKHPGHSPAKQKGGHKGGGAKGPKPLAPTHHTGPSQPKHKQQPKPKHAIAPQAPHPKPTPKHKHK